MDTHEQLKDQNMVQYTLEAFPSVDQNLSLNHDAFVLEPEIKENLNQVSIFDSKRFKNSQDVFRKAQVGIQDLNSEVNSEQSKCEVKVKKVKVPEGKMQIPRKISGDLMNFFEQLPKEEIGGILERLSSMNQRTPDMRVRLDIGKFLPQEAANFSLTEDHQSSDMGEMKRLAAKKRQERECKCCGQMVKRHQCKHTNCGKPCLLQDRVQKKIVKPIE